MYKRQQVDTVENGLKAMELFSKTEKGYYNAILMDIRMPLMDGLTAANSIRHLSNEDAQTIPIDVYKRQDGGSSAQQCFTGR